MSSRSPEEQIFTLRNILEQMTEWRLLLHLHFIDLDKVLDYADATSVDVMRRYGIHEGKIIYKIDF